MRVSKLSALCIAALAWALLLAPVPALAGGSGEFSGIAGRWTAHSMVLTIGDDGQAVAQWRVYQWCQDLSTPAPCDSIIGDEIVDGGLAMLRFTSISDSTATAIVLMSTESGEFTPGAQISLQLMPGGVAQFAGPGAGDTRLLCGPNLDRTVYPTYPCGA